MLLAATRTTQNEEQKVHWNPRNKIYLFLVAMALRIHMPFLKKAFANSLCSQSISPAARQAKWHLHEIMMIH